MTAEQPVHPSPLSLSAFDYDLPAELIAQYPSPERGASRMLVVRREGGTAGGREEPDADGPRPDVSPQHGDHGAALPALRPSRGPALEDRSFSDIASLIPPGDLVVLNTTRVRHARLIGRRPSGQPAEVLLLHPSGGDAWIALGKPGSALRPGKRISIGPEVEVETLEVLPDGLRKIRFIGSTAAEAMARHGRLPLPPYIHRDPDATDEDRYQTIYAEREGSVAAPTAGLHFTTELFAILASNGVRIGHLDLEVGPGTFKPVESENILEHMMHEERFEIPGALAGAVADTRSRGGKVWAVGTTVVRALESAAAGDGTVRAGAAETAIFITPGYRFRVVDHLVTNFHLPRSTLLMLVCAFAGYDLAMAAYRHAVGQRYRFYSYGDAMCVI